jgi:hypothetical protein
MSLIVSSFLVSFAYFSRRISGWFAELFGFSAFSWSRLKKFILILEDRGWFYVMFYLRYSSLCSFWIFFLNRG